MFHERLKRFALRFLPDNWLVGLKKIHYLRALRSATEDREPDLFVVRHLVAPGDTVVDLGANFGIYTAALSSLVGMEGKVVSVEPLPQTFELLAANVSKLGLNNVELHNVAISGENGSVLMEVPRYGSGGENFYEAHIVKGSVEPGIRTAEVRARTLDSLLESCQRVDFIKCDVEGHEWACLQGARNLLERFHPAWLIEVSGSPDRFGTPANNLIKLLGGQGYRPFWFDGSRMRPRELGDRSVNYFFLRPEHLQRIPEDFFDLDQETRRAA